MANLILTPASSIKDFITIGQIRNTCRCYMTRDQEHISISRQVRFYFRYYITNKFQIIYIGRNDQGKKIAYGLISYDDNLEPWVSGGILPKYRDQGYGIQLFKFLSEGWSSSVWLEVLESNTRALKLYTKLGFRETKRESRLFRSRRIPEHTETVITMKKTE